LQKKDYLAGVRAWILLIAREARLASELAELAAGSAGNSAVKRGSISGDPTAPIVLIVSNWTPGSWS
jgi:hypothetical protein